MLPSSFQVDWELYRKKYKKYAEISQAGFSMNELADVIGISLEESRENPTCYFEYNDSKEWVDKLSRPIKIILNQYLLNYIFEMENGEKIAIRKSDTMDHQLDLFIPYLLRWSSLQER